MKYLFILLLLSGSCKAQYQGDCSVYPFYAAAIHSRFSPNIYGVGFEVGKIAGDFENGRFSWFVGGSMLMGKASDKSTIEDYLGVDFYFKPMFTLVRAPRILHIYAVGELGVKDLQSLHLAGGLRAIIPIGNVGLYYDGLYSKEFISKAGVIFIL